MYFWTDTPDQVLFISAAAEVNRFRALITDPSTSEADAMVYGAQLIAAGEQMAAVFDAIVNDWYAWQVERNLTVPKMGKSGTIRFVQFSPKDEDIILEPYTLKQAPSGETFYWEDFYRMISLLCFFGRVGQTEGE